MRMLMVRQLPLGSDLLRHSSLGSENQTVRERASHSRGRGGPDRAPRGAVQRGVGTGALVARVVASAWEESACTLDNAAQGSGDPHFTDVNPVHLYGD